MKYGFEVNVDKKTLLRFLGLHEREIMEAKEEEYKEMREELRFCKQCLSMARVGNKVSTARVLRFVILLRRKIKFEVSKDGMLLIFPRDFYKRLDCIEEHILVDIYWNDIKLYLKQLNIEKPRKLNEY